MPFDPTNERKVTVPKTQLEQFVHDLVNDVEHDDRTRWSWLSKQDFFLRRRYGKAFRDVDWPWPGAASIVIPTMDMHIERLKPQFIQSTLGSRPVVTMLARSPEAQKKQADAEMFMDWLIESRIPDSAEQVAYGADNYLQYGMLVLKVFYDYRTRRIRDIITRARLPEELLQLIGGDQSPEELDKFFAITGKRKLTFKELSANRASLSPVVRRIFHLDPDDKDDAKAETEIVNWVLKGAKEPITVRRREVYRDTPRFVAIEPENFIAASYVRDLQDARRLVHRFYMTEEEIRERARDGAWNRESVNLLLARKRGGQAPRNLGRQEMLEQTRDLIFEDQRRVLASTTEGGMREDDLYEMWEVYTYYDLDGDGFSEKVILTLDPVSLAVMRIIELPFDHGQWPFVQIKFEHNDQRFYHTRGVAEKLDDLDVEITQQHRAKLNRMDIANAPVFLYRMGAGINPGGMRYIPGQWFPVSNLNDVKPLEIQNLDISFEREEQVLNGIVERYMGAYDSAISDSGRLTRPRSATEINAIGSIRGESLGARLLMWHKGWTRVYNMLWDLWHQYGPKEVWIRVVGSDSLIKLTREEIQGDFDFVPTPAALNNPVTQTQDALAQLQILAQVQPQMIGPEYEFNLGEALLSYLEKIDPRNARRIVRRRSEEEVQQVMQQQQAAAQSGEEPQPASLPQGASALTSGSGIQAIQRLIQ